MVSMMSKLMKMMKTKTLLNKYENLLNVTEDNGGRKTLIIDGTNMFIRVFSACPVLNDNGEHVGGIVGFLNSLRFLLKTFQPSRCIMVFDERGGSTRRKKIFPGYKAGRSTKIKTFNRFSEFKNAEDEERSMKYQFSRIIEYLNILPIYVLSITGIEADDTIAYIAKNECSDEKLVIVSTDKDFMQLIDDKVTVYNPTQKKLYDVKSIIERFGIIPENMITYRTLDGDASDCIPGVKGVGIKTIIKEFPKIKVEPFTVDDLIAEAKLHIKNNSKKKLFKTIVESVDLIDLNFKLMQLDDVDIAGEAKLKIHRVLSNRINKINRLAFRRMLVEDRIHFNIKDPDAWLSQGFTKIEFNA